MDTIKARILFLHTSRPYIDNDELSSIVISFPLGTLPNKGDILSIDNIKRREGSFVVVERIFQATTQNLYEVELVLGIEGIDDAT